MKRKKYTLNNIHSQIVKEVFRRKISIQDTHWLMTVLHFGDFLLCGEAAKDLGIIRLEGTTIREASNIAAGLWEGKRHNNALWYHTWGIEFDGIGKIEDLSEQDRGHLRRIIEKLESHPCLEKIDCEWFMEDGAA